MRGMSLSGRYGAELLVRVSAGRWRRWLVGGTAAVVLVFVYLARGSVLSSLGALLIVDTVGPSADYLVPLGGDAETRPFAAAELHADGVAPSVLLFEYELTEASRLGVALSQTELYRRVLEIQDVPAEAIRVIPGTVRNTWEEAQALKRFLATQASAGVVIVTSPPHTRRAYWSFRRSLQDLPVEIWMAPVRRPGIDETNWWHYDEMTLVYLRESFKLPFYWVRYAF